MNIAIIGGGWVGCHLAHKLKDEHTITIFEKNPKLFSETSYHNQNRLHLGYHYARNQKTRELCENTFDRFIADYSSFVKDIPRNYYCVPYDKSIIDYGTFKKIFYDYDHQEATVDFLNSIEGSLLVNEKHIDYEKANQFFNNELKHLVVHKNISEENITELSTQYDHVINCTNNQIRDVFCNSAYYELALTLIYENTQPLPFDAITLVDGDFFSIYPYHHNLYTVSDVEFTPISKFSTIEELRKYTLSDSTLEFTKKQIEDKIKKYYPAFESTFKYHSYFTSVKSKYKNQSADRYPILNGEGNVTHCFTGKIQGIYIIEDYVKEIIIGRDWTNRHLASRSN